MRSVLAPGLLAASLLVAMPGSAAGRSGSAVSLEAGCLDGGPGPQFMNLSDVFPSARAAMEYLHEKEWHARPDSGVVDSICTPGTILIFELRELPLEEARERLPLVGRSR